MTHTIAKTIINGVTNRVAFDYLYRDLSNNYWNKRLILDNPDDLSFTTASRLIKQFTQDGIHFSAHQVGLPVLFPNLARSPEPGLDHGWHEFFCLDMLYDHEIKQADEESRSIYPMTLKQVVDRFERCAHRWEEDPGFTPINITHRRLDIAARPEKSNAFVRRHQMTMA